MRARFRYFIYCFTLCVFGVLYGLVLYAHGPSGIFAQFAAFIYAPVLLPVIVFAYLAYRIGNKVLVIVLALTSVILGYLLGFLVF